MSQRRLIRIASGCKTEDQFVAVFHRFCDGDSIFIATKTPKPVGETLSFCVTLADGEPLLAGTGAVSESYVDKTGPFARPGMRITFSNLEDGSEPVLKRLTQAAEKASAQPPKKPRATVLGIPPIVSPAPPATPGPKAATAATPESSKSGIDLPSPVVKTRPLPPRKPTPPPIPRPVSRSVDDSWSEVNEPAAQRARALGSESESSGASVDAAVGAAVDALTGPAGDNAVEANEDQRVPHSGIVLPANPFGELNSESLEHFVECTIYEERAPTGEPTGELASEGSGPVVMAPAAEPEPDVVSGMIGEASEPALVTSEPPRSDPPIAPVAAQRPPMPMPMPMPMVAHARAPTDLPFIARAVPMTWALGGVGVALITGLIVGYVIWGGGSTTAPAKDDSPDSNTSFVAPQVDAAPVADAAAPVAPVDAGEPRIAEACSVDVGTEPEGSEVKLGDKRLGETPGNFVVPCGDVAITVDHPRYAALTRTVSTEPGTPAELEGSLERPVFKLTVRTQPSKATVSINGRRVGVSPVTLSVRGFERHKVVVSKRGYRAAGRRVYLKETNAVNLRLRRLRRRR
jgi:hypothetical protein